MLPWISPISFYMPMLVWVAGIILSLVYRRQYPRKYLVVLTACLIFLLGDIAQILFLKWWSEQANRTNYLTYSTYNTISTLWKVFGWIVLFYAIFNWKINIVNSENPPTFENMNRKETITVLIFGAVLASIGGVIKYFLLMGSSIDLDFAGIILPYFFCMLEPLIGSMLGWLGGYIGFEISNSKKGIYVGGILGGILTAIILMPLPIFAQ